MLDKPESKKMIKFQPIHKSLPTQERKKFVNRLYAQFLVLTFSLEVMRMES